MAIEPVSEAGRAAVWRALGATADETRELLAYADSAFDLAQAPARFPLPDEPFVAAWEAYVDEAERAGAWACLRDRLVQLRFPIAAGISESPAYLAATRRGVWPDPDARGLDLERPDALRVFLTDTPVGRIPVVVAATRADFIALVRALAHRNEPWPIQDTVGASIIGGFNNWDRVAALRRAWEATADSPLGWAVRWREIVREPGLYQDRFIVLSSGPYSGAAAADVGLGDAAWAQRSVALRLEHECTHHFTRRALGSMRNRLADELIADYMGIVAAAGQFRPDWLVRFLTGRLDEYRGDLAPGGGSFRILAAAIAPCARNLAAIDRLRPAWTRSSESSADKAEMILALAAIGLEGLAGDAAVELYQAARHQR